jgi:BirA family transcriptional regulator, biotin operon repressor / biotin---[acetyl-CoA-carboxylase] ligase
MSKRRMKERVFVKKTQEFLKNLHIDVVKNLFVFDELDSTNSTAKVLAQDGAEQGTIVIARTQNHGRGRFDHIWQSPEGGVYLSFILRPKTSAKKTSLLPFVAALALTKTIETYNLHATIKWPNDVRVNGKKIAGILLESEVIGQMINYVVVGIGMNLNIDITYFSPDIQPQSTSIIHELGRPVDYHEFLKTFFIQFEVFYKLFVEQQYDRIIDEWKNHTDTLGKTIRVQTSTETVQGIASDIDQSGFLVLRTERGETKKIMSGDCLYFDELYHS